MTRAYTEQFKLVVTSTEDSIKGANGALTISSGGNNSNVTIAPQGTGSVDVSNTKVTNLANPTGDSDAATKAYVDASLVRSWRLLLDHALERLGRSAG